MTDEHHADRRSFLRTGAIAGTALVAGASAMAQQIAGDTNAPLADGDIAIMTISDDGQGFEAKTEGKRHGLGLVWRLIEQVRGTAMVDSGHGTFWTIRFPLA